MIQAQAMKKRGTKWPSTAPITGPASTFVTSEITPPPTPMTVMRVRWRNGAPISPMNIATM